MTVQIPNRDITKLTARMQKKVNAFLNLCGDRVFITEGWRSQERQDYLYSLGRTRPGNKVTWTKQSSHQDGVAIDIAFYGSDLYPADHGKRKDIADIAKECGIQWPYADGSIFGQKKPRGIDKPHFEDNGHEYDGSDYSEQDQGLTIERDPTGFIITDEFPRPDNIFAWDRKIFTTTQGKNQCGIAGPQTATVSQYNVDLKKNTLLDMKLYDRVIKNREKLGIKEFEGGASYKNVNSWRNAWKYVFEKVPKRHAATFAVPILNEKKDGLSEHFEKAILSNYMLTISRKTNSSFLQDQKNKIIDISDHGKHTGNHMENVMLHEKGIMHVNNYSYRDRNEYLNPHFVKQVQSGWIDNFAIVRIPKVILDQDFYQKQLAAARSASGK